MTTCQQLKQDYRKLEALAKEFDLELPKAVKTGKTERIKELRAELEQRRDALREKLDIYNIALRRRIAEAGGFQFVGNFSKTEGLARVEKAGQWFYIDRAGKEITVKRFDDAWDFSEGLARVKKAGQWFYIDKAGEEITAERFDQAGDFSEGLAWVEKDGQWFY